MKPYDRTMELLVTTGDGEIQGRFVKKPGVLVLATHSGLTPYAKKLFQALNLDMRQSDDMLLGEFGARLTYLSFPSGLYDADAYHRKLVDELGHLSSYSMPLPAVLIAGCSLEAGQEFVAHHEAQIARMTSSATKAQDTPFFTLQGTETEQSIMQAALEQILALELLDTATLSREARNMLNPACKATAMVVGMSIKDWRKVLKGRQSPVGVEAEVVDLAIRTQNALAQVYPAMIPPVEVNRA